MSDDQTIVTPIRAMSAEATSPAISPVAPAATEQTMLIADQPPTVSGDPTVTLPTLDAVPAETVPPPPATPETVVPPEALPPPSTPDGFASGAAATLAPATGGIDATKEAAEGGRLQISREGAEAMLARLETLRGQAKEILARSTELDQPLRFGDNWVGQLMSQRFRGAVDGDSNSVRSVLHTYYRSLDDLADTVRAAAESYLAEDDRIADEFARLGADRDSDHSDRHDDRHDEQRRDTRADDRRTDDDRTDDDRTDDDRTDDDRTDDDRTDDDRTEDRADEDRTTSDDNAEQSVQRGK